MAGLFQRVSDDLRQPMLGWYIPVLFTIAILAVTAFIPSSFIREYAADISVFEFAIATALLTGSSLLYLRRFLAKQSALSFLAFFVMLQALLWEILASVTYIVIYPSSLMTADWLVVAFTTLLVLVASADLLIGYLLLDWIGTTKKRYLAFLTIILSGTKLALMFAIIETGHPYFLPSGILSRSLPVSDLLLVASVVIVIISLSVQKKMLSAEMRTTIGGLAAYILLITFGLLLLRFPGLGVVHSVTVSEAALTFAPLFPFWGVVLQEEGENRKTIRLMGILNKYRPGLDSSPGNFLEGRPQNSGLALLATAFPGSVSFTYRSKNCVSWHLVTSSTIGQASIEAPQLFQADMRQCVRAGEQVILDSTKEDPAVEPLKQSLKNEFGASIFMSYDGEFEITGVLREGDIGWENSELTFINNLSWLIKSETLSNELSEKQQMMTLRLLTLVEASHRLVDSKEPKSLYETVCELLTERLGYSDTSIWVNVEGRGLKLEAYRFNESIMVPVAENVWMPHNKGIISHCAQSMRPYRTGNVAGDPHYVELMTNETKSEYAVPIVLNDRCVAVLDVESRRPDDFDTNDMQVVGIVSDLVAVMLRNIELYGSVVAAQRMSEIRANLLAHDLKNMFQPITLNMAVLKERISSDAPLTGKEVALIENTMASINSASKFVNGVLQLVRLGNSSNVRLRDMDISAVVRNAVSTVKSTYSQKKIEFQTIIEDEARYVRGTELVEEVFVNLFVNAIKYNNSDTVKIWVEASHQDGPHGRSVLLKVSDNGVGIPEERRKMVFERFSAGASGSGIGLSLAKGIMESIGGSITVGPRIMEDHTKGTSFQLEFCEGAAPPRQKTIEGERVRTL